MRVRIYQIQSERDKKRLKFCSFTETERLGGIDPTTYQCVYAGDIQAKSLDEVYSHLNAGRKPTTYQGHSLSVSDVVEVIGDIPEVYGYIDYYRSNGEVEERYYVRTKEEYNKVLLEDIGCGRPYRGFPLCGQPAALAEKGFYFCDSIGWKKVDFDASRAEPMKGVRVLMIQPHQKPIETRVIDRLDCWQRAVSDHGEDALIEVVSPFDDNAVVVCNEESKYNGMEGNRRLYGDVIAGPMFLVGDDGYGGFCDLTDRQIREYGEQFAEPEDISPEEVEKALRFDFYGP